MDVLESLPRKTWKSREDLPVRSLELLDKHSGFNVMYLATDLMGKKAIEILNEDRAPTTAATSPTTNANKAESPGSAPPRARSFAAYPAGTLLLSLLSAFASSL